MIYFLFNYFIGKFWFNFLSVVFSVELVYVLYSIYLSIGQSTQQLLQ
jgi:hypothetical protein